MLAIEIIGKGFLELPPDIEITLNYNFDTFVFEPTEGSWSVPYSVQATAHNRKILGYANRATAKFSAAKACRLWHSGVVIAEGTQRIEVANEMIEGVLEFGNGNFWALTKDKKLNELPIRDYEFENTPDEDVEAWLNASNSGSYPDFKFACYPIYAPNYGTESEPILGFQKWINENYLGEIYFNESKKDYTIIQPYVCYILDEIFKYYNYSIRENYLKESEFKQLTLFSLRRQINPQPFYSWREYQFGFWLLPEIGVQELIIALENMLCIRFNFDHTNKTVAIIDINSVLNNPIYEDITSKVHVITNTQYEDQVEYILKQAVDENDLYAEQQKEYDYNATQNTYVISSTLTGLKQVPHTTEATYVPQDIEERTEAWAAGMGDKADEITMTCPRTDFDNINKPDEKQKMPAKFLFYRGRIADHRRHFNGSVWVEVPGYTYPYATASNLDDQGFQLPNCEHTLYWGGANGLYEKRWKNYFYWLQNIKRTEERNIDFSAAQIRNLKPYQKYRIEGVDYFIQKMEVSLGLREVKRCKCEIVMC